MSKPFKTLDDMGDVRGKRVLVREDLNVPMAEGAVTDDTRLRATVATVGELADKGAIVLILAHFGRPKGNPSPEFSLSQVVRPYSDVLGREVWRVVVPPSPQGRVAVPVAALAPGLYICELSWPNQAPATRKLVVQH